MGSDRSAVKKSDFSASHYLYSVGWSEEDQAFLARVAEFPSLGAHGKTATSAWREITSLVASILKDLQKSGEPIPEPIGRQHFSGKLNLRMPPSLHMMLAVEASQQGISLNQWINLKLQKR